MVPTSRPSRDTTPASASCQPSPTHLRYPAFPRGRSVKNAFYWPDIALMLDLIFADDSAQLNPTRDGMRPLKAIGGIHVAGQQVLPLERELNRICGEWGFPNGKEGEFKWSPGRDRWMHQNLVGQAREKFFYQVLDAAAEAGVRAVVVIEDTDCALATGADSRELDLANMFIERISKRLTRVDRTGVIVVDRPGGERLDEDHFLADCGETLQRGTNYVPAEDLRISMVLVTSSKHARLVQLADLVTGCHTAAVAGEVCYAPQILERILPISDSIGDIRGGIGLKLHPDFRYVNLYHWLLGDARERVVGGLVPLPRQDRPYAESPDV